MDRGVLNPAWEEVAHYPCVSVFVHYTPEGGRMLSPVFDTTRPRLTEEEYLAQKKALDEWPAPVAL